MRISQIMLSKGFGGAERHFVDLTLALVARGHSIQVICNRSFPAHKYLEATTGLQIDSITVRGTWDLIASWRIGALLKAFAPDIAHAHLARAAHLTGRATRQKSPLLVTNTHNYIKLKYYKYVRGFVVATGAQQSYLTCSGIDTNCIVSIPHFSRFSDPFSPKRSGGRTFISLGRLVKKKGFDILLEALSLLRGRGIDADLVIGGDGCELLHLMALSKHYKIESNVRFVGWVDVVKDFLLQGDVFVLPSLDEPFGIVLLEAMATGLPIISTRTDGPSQILSDCSAYMVDPGNSLQLSWAMQETLERPAERAGRARNAALSYGERYTENVVIPQYENFYRALLK